MEPLVLLVPAVATAALGGALFVPIRDGRAGRKATVDGRSPLLADFRNVAPADVAASTEPTDAERSAEVTDGDAPPPAEPVEVADAGERPGAGGAGDESPIKLFDPFELVRSVARRFRPHPVEQAPDDDIVSERSFADELSLLLPASVEFSPLASAASFAANQSPGPAERSRPSAAQDTVVAFPVPAVDVRSSSDAADAMRTHDVGPSAVPSNRVVPLTRLPLRHRTKDVTWPAYAIPPRTFATATERHGFLRSGASETDGFDDALLARAFREETSEGRMLALCALRRPDASRDAIEAFAEALATGSDDERAFAVDALSEAGAREEIARGVADRIDAIAAKAALAYVGTTARDDYRAALAPLVDDSRIDTILALLAGVVE